MPTRITGGGTIYLYYEKSGVPILVTGGEGLVSHGTRGVKGTKSS